MNISGDSLRSLVGSYATQTQSTSSVTLSTSSDSSSTDGTSSSSQAATTGFSDPSQFLSGLKKLETTDPAKFKSTLNDIASHLKDAAAKIGGTQGQQLSKAAEQFTEAAKTGDLSKIQPPSGGKPQSPYSQNGGDTLAQLLSSSAQSTSNSASSTDLSALLNSISSSKTDSAHRAS